MAGRGSKSKYNTAARIVALLIAIMMLSSIFVLIAIAVHMV